MIRDMMPNFELLQPTKLADALTLLDRRGKDIWKMAGGNDSLDWFNISVESSKFLRQCRIHLLMAVHLEIHLRIHHNLGYVSRICLAGKRKSVRAKIIAKREPVRSEVTTDRKPIRSEIILYRICRGNRRR